MAFLAESGKPDGKERGGRSVIPWDVLGAVDPWKLGEVITCGGTCVEAPGDMIASGFDVLLTVALRKAGILGLGLVKTLVERLGNCALFRESRRRVRILSYGKLI